MEQFIETDTRAPPYFVGDEINIGCKATGYRDVIGELTFSASPNPRNSSVKIGCLLSISDSWSATNELRSDSDLSLDRITENYCKTAALSDPFILRLTTPITDAHKDRQFYCHVFVGSAYESPVEVTVISNIQG